MDTKAHLLANSCSQASQVTRGRCKNTHAQLHEFETTVVSFSVALPKRRFATPRKMNTNAWKREMTSAASKAHQPTKENRQRLDQ